MRKPSHIDSPRRQPHLNPIPAEQRDAVDVPTTAALLGISRRTVYELIADGQLASIKIRSRRLIPRKAREDLIERLLSDADR